MAADSVTLFLVVALPAEARPWLDHYRLGKCADVEGFRCYRKDNVCLIVSGPGKGAAAAAVAYAQGRFAGAVNQVWINVGIGGHASLPLGSLVRAGRIEDGDSRRSWFPPLIDDSAALVAEIRTVVLPETAYQGECVYDMEAAGFCESALRFSTAELVQCYKVISDNRQQGADRVTPELAEGLIREQVPVLVPEFERLQGLARELQGDPEIERVMRFCLDRWHFSQYQRKELARLLQRATALDGNLSAITAALTELAGSREVNHFLQQYLAAKQLSPAGA